MLLQYVRGVIAFRYSALFRVVRWFNFDFPRQVFLVLPAIACCLCMFVQCFFSLFIHSFLFPRASETSGLSHQWKPFPKLCWHKAHAVDRNIVNHLLRTGRAAGELVSISCEQMFPGGRLPAWSWFLKKHLLAEKCWFNCVAHIHMMCFPSVSKKKPLKRYLKTYHVDVAWWLRSLWSPWCVVRKHAGSKVWVGRAHVDES